jgi:transcription elongation factor GreA
MPQVHYMSQEGLDKIKKELEEAIAQRPVIAAQIAEAREKGDLSENAEYESAREAQGLLELKIANLQNTIANAKVVDASQISTDKVQMLNTVKVKNLNAGAVMTFTIVGEKEADFSKGKLAATTPIAKALIGHGKGEVVEAQVPAGAIKFEILEISF